MSKSKNKKNPHKSDVKKLEIVIYTDSNCLYTTTKSLLVCSEFLNLIEDHSPRAKIKLLLPEVVLHELSRQTSRAFYSNFREHQTRGKEISDTLNLSLKDHLVDLSETKVQQLVEKLYEKLLLDNPQFEGEVLNTPSDKISFSEALNLAMEREAPFEITHDKGIKDYAILKTIVEHIQTTGSKKSIYVVTNDGRLRTALVAALKNQNNVELPKDFAEVSRILTKQIENVQDQWVTQINKLANDEVKEKLETIKHSILFNGDSHLRVIRNPFRIEMNSLVRNPEIVTEIIGFKILRTDFHSIAKQNTELSIYEFWSEFEITQNIREMDLVDVPYQHRDWFKKLNFKQLSNSMNMRYIFRQKWNGEFNKSKGTLTFGKLLELSFESKSQVPEQDSFAAHLMELIGQDRIGKK